jgi:copper(I)-binding protein
MTSPVNSAAYLTIENRGDATDRLVGVSFDAAQRVELHESFVDEQGIASMRPVSNVELPAGGEARLEPGGLHVMLFGLDAPLSAGDSVRLVLEFEVSGRLTVTAVVRRL